MGWAWQLQWYDWISMCCSALWVVFALSGLLAQDAGATDMTQGTVHCDHAVLHMPPSMQAHPCSKPSCHSIPVQSTAGHAHPAVSVVCICMPLTHRRTDPTPSALYVTTHSPLSISYTHTHSPHAYHLLTPLCSCSALNMMLLPASPPPLTPGQGDTARVEPAQQAEAHLDAQPRRRQAGRVRRLLQDPH